MLYHSTLRNIVCLCKTQLKLNSSTDDERIAPIAIGATLINQGTIAGIKNANSISSHRYFKLEWQKFFRKISAIGNGFVI